MHVWMKSSAKSFVNIQQMTNSEIFSQNTVNSVNNVVLLQKKIKIKKSILPLFSHRYVDFAVLFWCDRCLYDSNH